MHFVKKICLLKREEDDEMNNNGFEKLKTVFIA